MNKPTENSQAQKYVNETTLKVLPGFSGSLPCAVNWKKDKLGN